MGLRRSVHVAVLVVGLLGLAPAAQAQETGVVGELERTAATTPQEKRRYASDANEEIRAALKSIARMVEVARRDSNVERLQCVNARLAAIRALASVSEGAETAMLEALAAGEGERADHEFRKIAVARIKTRELLAEAERCADDSAPRVGETEVIVEGEPPGDDSDLDAVESDPFDLGFDATDESPFL